MVTHAKDRWHNWGLSGRAAFIAKMIPENSTVLDCGAGNTVLEKYLPEGCTYIPLDKVERCERTVVRDLNVCSDLPDCDVAVFVGVLEYIEDVDRVVALLNCHTAIVTYATHGDWRRNGWMRRDKVDIVKSFEDAGFELVTDTRWMTHAVMEFHHSREATP